MNLPVFFVAFSVQSCPALSSSGGFLFPEPHLGSRAPSDDDPSYTAGALLTFENNLNNVQELEQPMTETNYKSEFLSAEDELSAEPDPGRVAQVSLKTHDAKRIKVEEDAKRTLWFILNAEDGFEKKKPSASMPTNAREIIEDKTEEKTKILEPINLVSTIGDERVETKGNDEPLPTGLNIVDFAQNDSTKVSNSTDSESKIRYQQIETMNVSLSDQAPSIGDENRKNTDST